MVGRGRTFTPMAPDIEKMMAEHDAGLVIGDPALKVDRSRYLTYDLAEEWIRLTGKPFVFAFWAVRQAALKDAPAALDLATLFQDSRDHGLQPANLDRIAREWAPRLGLSEADIKTYLTENIYYDLDPACLEGLQLFYRYASECGALPAAPHYDFSMWPKLPLANSHPVWPYHSQLKIASKVEMPTQLHFLIAVSVWSWLRHLGGVGLVLLGLADNSVVPCRGAWTF